jgi:Carboxypeptidase regulatory-like domain
MINSTTCIGSQPLRVRSQEHDSDRCPPAQTGKPATRLTTNPKRMVTQRSPSSRLLLVLTLVLTHLAYAVVGGRISGTVTDPHGYAISGASVVVVNLATGVQQTVSTNRAGVYSIPDLAVGGYDVDVSAAGFKPYTLAGVVVDVNSQLLVDAVLQVGEASQTVTVTDSSLHAETTSTQLGDVIKEEAIEALPLNGRSYTDLLALQPGVTPVTTITPLTVQGLGQSVYSPSGDLNPGVLSIHGQREAANGFMVNGADAEEKGSLAAAIIPNLDSILEFRILSDNFDAHYGRYTGGQINVITKSGTNQLHGNVFEFLRNTDLDATQYFSPERGVFRQNQFGGTVGGPIVRNKLFFFSDYQGTRQTQGIASGQIPVPTTGDRTGNLADQASTLTNVVTTAYFANRLSNQLGYPVLVNEPYYFTGCTSSSQCVMPNGIIPQSGWSAPAAALLKYIPAPNNGPDTFSTSASNQTIRDDKFGQRIDADTPAGSIFFYCAFDDYSLDNPYPTTQGGANVPGFNGLYSGRVQLFDLGDTNIVGSSAVNTFHISYTRDANVLGKPAGGLGVSLASQGFVTGTGSLGIVPSTAEGVENVVFNGGSLVIGTVPAQFDQINNDFDITDNFSKVLGTHSLKAGVQLEYDQIDTHPYAFLNGSFNFNGTETGSAFADYLLGISSLYTQNQLRPFYGRNKYIGIYLEDSWRATPSLTLNAGLRWDRIEPWYEKYNNSITFIPGEQSIVFPTAPKGIVYPGDPGVSRTLAPPGNKDFAPRIGFAYSPRVDDDSPLANLFGGKGQTSIRASFGIFYAAIAGESLGLISDNPPYGYTFQNSSNPLFVTPFVDGDTGNVEGQRFPATLAPNNVSPSHPDSSIDFSQFEPIGATPGYRTTNTIPYTDEYTLSLQRQIGANTLVTLNYVGNQGHHLPVLEPANPGDPALCLSLAPACGPNGEDNSYTLPSGAIIGNTRGALGANFGSVSYQTTIANSTYNAFEASVQHTTHRVQFLASYTYSKSLDMASNFAEQVDPFYPKLLRGLSSFNMEHDFVASYTYKIPFEDMFHRSNRLTTGWSISGITRFSTGLPVTLMNPLDTSLLGTFGNGINNLTVDALDYTPGHLSGDHNPRHGQPYFNTSLLTLPADNPTVGYTIANTIGNSGRRFFSGPGIDNFDMTAEKDVKIAGETSLDLRLDAFNLFNHAQFYGPLSVDGDISDSTFGQVVSAAAPRLLQVGAKINF